MKSQTMTNFESPYYPSNYGNDEYDFDEEHDEGEDENEMDQEESDEDTEEASESETRRGDMDGKEHKDKLFKEKLNMLKSQLQQLKDRSLPEYLRRVKPLEQKYKERIRLNEVWREHQIELMEKDFIAEKRAASKEFDEKVVELKENLVQEMEEKKRIIEAERVSMELTGDSTETKPAVTRKLRRRPNDPAPLPDKRRGNKTLPSQINFLLDDKEIELDLKAIARGIKSSTSLRKSGPMPSNGVQPVIPNTGDSSLGDTRIEDGKLLFERRWFHRGQPVFVEGRDLPKFPAIISAIGSEAVVVKKTIDASKVKINISQLIRGKVSIKRRAS